MTTEILAFLITFGLARFLTLLVRDTAQTRGWLHAPQGNRHLHLRPMPRLGGVAIFLSFVVVAVLSPWFFPLLSLPVPVSTSVLARILGPAALIFALGLFDDVFGSSPYLKFGVQSVAAIWLYVGNISIERLDLLVGGDGLRTMVGLPLTIFWVLLITNSFNLIDGLDGLTAGCALFTTVVLCVQLVISDNLEVAFLAVLLAGAILGFLRYNFHPASIFLGDSGSLFIGFLISTLALVGSQKSTIMLAVAIPVVSCGLPVLDVILAVMRRYMNDKPLFAADQDHIHHKLLKLGLSQRNAVLTLYAVSACFALLSLAMFHGGAVVAFLVVITGVGVYLGLRRLHYEEFVELQRLIQQLFRQRQIIRNNLRIRRAAQLLEGCQNPVELCEVLEEALRPLGFAGYRLLLPPDAVLPEDFPDHLRKVGDKEYQCVWRPDEQGSLLWELKLPLHDSSGTYTGSLTVLRNCGEESLLLDFSILTTKFQQGLARTMARLTRGSLALKHN